MKTVKIFINLPVADLKQSMAFYTALGFVNNPRFTDETAAAMLLNDNINVMLLTHKRFTEFTPKKIADTGIYTEVLNALLVDTREDVDQMVETALAQGAKAFRPAQDHGFMYDRAFEDLDGHIWEIGWMDATFIAG